MDKGIASKIEIYELDGLKLKLSEIIDHLGAPGKVFARARPMSMVNGFAEVYVELYYPQAGLIFQIHVPVETNGNNDPVTFCFHPDQLLDVITVVQPDSIANILRNTRSLTNLEIEKKINMMIDWAGFSCISI
jgi:hypothetical protein